MVEDDEQFLRLFTSGAAISEERLTATLGVGPAALRSRVAAWRSRGAAFECTAEGYRLADWPDRPTAAAVRALWPIEATYPVRHVETTSSTMQEARLWARQGAPAGATVVSEHQQSGRGRRGRHWQTPPGEALLASIVLRPRLDARCAGWLPLAAAVAIADVVAAMCGRQVGIKWPNDVLADGRKLAGVLLELETDGRSIRHVVCGIGFNVHQRAFPEMLTDRAVSLRQWTGQGCSRARLLAALVPALIAGFDEDVDSIWSRWRRHDRTLGRPVRLRLANGREADGLATSLDNLGRLVLRTEDGCSEAFAAGDVEFAHAVDGGA